MVKEKVFITGVSGFIGSYLADRLVKEGYEVAGLLRHSNRLNHPNVQKLTGQVKMYYGSLLDNAATSWAIRDFQPDYVCHLGAVTPVAYSFEHPNEVTETNYLGTINLAEACKREVKHLKKFIFASSMETYGSLDKREPFVEEDRQMPACPYAVAKVASEKYLKYLKFAYNFPSVMFRQTNCYGRRENDYFVIEAIITQMLKNPKEISLGDGRPVRNFIYIEDMLDLWQTTIECKDEAILGEAFNTGPGNGLSIEDLAEKIGDQLEWKGKINWNTRPSRPGEIFYLNSSHAKAKKMLGFLPKFTLEEGINETIKIWKENLKI